MSKHVEKSVPFNEFFKLIEDRYIILFGELKLSINIGNYLRTIKEK